jgi:hypothetical protein
MIHKGVRRPRRRSLLGSAPRTGGVAALRRRFRRRPASPGRPVAHDPEPSSDGTATQRPRDEAISSRSTCLGSRARRSSAQLATAASCFRVYCATRWPTRMRWAFRAGPRSVGTQFLLSLSFSFLGFSGPVLAYRRAPGVSLATPSPGGGRASVSRCSGLRRERNDGLRRLVLADHERPTQLNLPRVYAWLLGGISVTQWVSRTGVGMVVWRWPAAGCSATAWTR